MALNEINISIDKIILKPFAEAVHLIFNNKYKNNFFIFELKKNQIQLSLFKNKSFIYSENFNFGLNLIIKDISKLCSLKEEDIGSQLWKYGAKSITVSHRTAPMGYKWPDNWKEVPLLTKVEGNTAHFKDGTTKDVDAVILCTGYKHHFPFLPDSLRLKTPNVLASNDLYKGTTYVHEPDLFYLGMQDQWFTFNMFDAQAWWVRDVIMDRIALPDHAAMLADVDARKAAEAALEDDYACIWYQGDYTKELIDETDYPSFDVEGACQAFKEWKGHKKANIMTFRNNAYKSVITGTMAPLHHTPWNDALDDSLEVYLQN